MSRLKDGMSCPVIDIGTGGDADTAYHGRQLVGYVITVQVQRGYDGILFRNEQRVLQESVGYAVLDNQTALRNFLTELLFRQLIPPFLKPPSVNFMIFPL